MISLLSAYQRNRNKLPDKSESVSVRTKRPSTRIDLGQIVPDFPLYLTKCKYLAYQFDFLSLPLSISLSLFFSLFWNGNFYLFIHSLPRCEWWECEREKKMCVTFIHLERGCVLFVSVNLYGKRLICIHSVACRHQVPKTYIFFLDVYSNANGFLLKAGKNAFLHSFREKKLMEKNDRFFIHWVSNPN